MKEHLREKLVKFEKYAPRLVESHVVLKKEKYVYWAEITLLAKHLRAYGEAGSKENIFTAIDQAYVRVEKQLKRFREKLKAHHNNELDFKGERAFADSVDAAASTAANQKTRRKVREAETEDRPQVIRSRAFAGKPMSAEEASLQLSLTTKPFLFFQNAVSQQVNIIFKRDDGNHGLIEPAF